MTSPNPSGTRVLCNDSPARHDTSLSHAPARGEETVDTALADIAVLPLQRAA